jgi:Putative metal-binding motif
VVALLLSGCGPSMSGSDGGPTDPTKDTDGDGVTGAQGDCNDRDPSVYPGAPELCDNKDNDCDGDTDGPCDNDMDGYTRAGGDCDDHDPLVNPGAIEVADNMIDDNCDGKVDEKPAPCLDNGIADPMGLTNAMGLCAPWVVAGGAAMNQDADAASHAIRTDYGKYKARQGTTFAAISTGIVAAEADMTFVQPQPGTAFHNDDPNPFPQMKKSACYSGPDENLVHDYVELAIKVKVPTNAKSFSFNFNFLSAEYPEYVGSQYNDKFLVLLDSKQYKGNISYDKNQNPITVNVAFFDVCDTADICGGQAQNACTRPATDLDGTGYELDDGSGQRIGGGTGWLTTTAPVTPGETATVRFILFDEGDHLFDSTVLIDNFQWQLNAAMGPTTVG